MKTVCTLLVLGIVASLAPSQAMTDDFDSIMEAQKEVGNVLTLEDFLSNQQQNLPAYGQGQVAYHEFAQVFELDQGQHIVGPLWLTMSPTDKAIVTLERWLSDIQAKQDGGDPDFEKGVDRAMKRFKVIQNYWYGEQRIFMVASVISSLPIQVQAAFAGLGLTAHLGGVRLDILKAD
ncbi:MAG: hypothetical protein LBI20_00330 [Holosporales bacterium]|jgi:hypothetical protein|nr:hypothetical protein [Holosporales bacterium]